MGGGWGPVELEAAPVLTVMFSVPWSVPPALVSSCRIRTRFSVAWGVGRVRRAWKLAWACWGEGHGTGPGFLASPIRAPRVSSYNSCLWGSGLGAPRSDVQLYVLCVGGDRARGVLESPEPEVVPVLQDVVLDNANRVMQWDLTAAVRRAFHSMEHPS